MPKEVEAEYLKKIIQGVVCAYRLIQIAPTYTCEARLQYVRCAVRASVPKLQCKNGKDFGHVANVCRRMVNTEDRCIGCCRYRGDHEFMECPISVKEVEVTKVGAIHRIPYVEEIKWGGKVLSSCVYNIGLVKQYNQCAVASFQSLHFNGLSPHLFWETLPFVSFLPFMFTGFEMVP